MSTYASDTKVPSERSRMEIEHTLARYGATAFAYMTDGTKAIIQFQARDKRIRFVLPLPDPETREIKFHSYRGEVTDRRRAPGQVLAMIEQETRQRWRALSLVIKAKLEAAQAGITTFEREFMAHIVLPNGRTVEDMVAPQIELAYKSGKVPSLLQLDGPR